MRSYRYRRGALRAWLSAILLLLSCMPAAAGPPGEITLAEAVKAALARHPRLAAFAPETEAADGRILQSSKRPNPELEFEMANTGGNYPPFNRTETTVAYSHPIEWGKRALRVRRSEAEKATTLRDQQRVSVLYITHDLATAFYISDRIAIMLRGYIVETGPVEDVLERPLHPYSQLLKESVPEPEPKEKEAWARQITLGATEVKEYGRVGCKFAGRCPHVMDICRQVDPPDVQVDQRTVKCYLYTEHAPQPVSRPTVVKA